MANVQVLKKIYYDTKHPAGFSGATNVQRITGLSKKQVDTWLRKQEPYTLHAPVRKRFVRNYYKVSRIDDTWQADLCDMRYLGDQNDGIKFILTVIDILSKYAWAVGLKDKSAQTIKQALTNILDESGRCPSHLNTDKGKEFVSETMRQFYRSRGINFYTSQNPDIKCAVIERFNRTLKTRMWRYFTYKNTRRYVDVLPDLLHAYNHSFHRSIQLSPADVNKANERVVLRNLYADKRKLKSKKPKYNIGDHVRITREKTIFEKGFDQNWSREIFKISNIVYREVIVYELEDLGDEKVQGTFYEPELLRVELPKKYKIERVIQTKGRGNKRQLLVKWAGYPEKFNSWIAATDLL